MGHRLPRATLSGAGPGPGWSARTSGPHDAGETGRRVLPTTAAGGPPVPRDPPLEPAVAPRPPVPHDPPVEPAGDCPVEPPVTPGLTIQPPLSITTWRLSGDTIQLDVAGEIDMATSPKLRQALLDAIGAGGPGTAVQVDVAGVSFIDAGGIGILVEAGSAAVRARVTLSLHRPSAIVRRLLDILGLTDALRVVPASATP